MCTSADSTHVDAVPDSFSRILLFAAQCLDQDNVKGAQSALVASNKAAMGRDRWDVIGEVRPIHGGSWRGR